MIDVKIIKRIIGVFTGIMCLTSIILAFTQRPITPFLFEAALFGIATFFLMKSKKKPSSEESDHLMKQSEESVVLETPEETLDEIKSVKSSIHTGSLVRVIQSSIQIMNTTRNIESLCDRYEDSLKKAYTLKELEQSGISKTSPDEDYYIKWLYDNHYKCIQRCYTDYLDEVMTANGKENRKRQFFVLLAKHIDEFELQDIKEMLQ